jgi:hypothetical protein
MTERQASTIARIGRALQVAMNTCERRRQDAINNGLSNSAVLGRTVPAELAMVVKQSIAEIKAMIEEHERATA